MARKLLISRLGAGTITVALCAALPGCNLALGPTSDCVGNPSSRGMSSIECPDGAADAVADADAKASPDSPRDTTSDTAVDHP